MKKQDIKTINHRISQIKLLLNKIGDMRPGSLSQRTIVLKSGKIYKSWQISYTRKMKSKTNSVKDEDLKDTKLQIKNYLKFKELTTEWVDLAIELAILKTKIDD